VNSRGTECVNRRKFKHNWETTIEEGVLKRGEAEACIWGETTEENVKS